MEHPCPRCGSDAAVTWTSVADGMQYTCRFSHDGEGPVTWIVPAKSRPAARARTPRSTTRAVGASAPPRQPRSAASASSRAAAQPPAPPRTVNERGIEAVVEEVTRRGGRAQVEHTGSKREVVVTGEGGDGEVRLLVRARTAGTWQTRASFGEPRAEDEHPTTFWVLVHLSPGAAQCYVVPDWWMRNDIYETHEEYLRWRSESRSLNPESDHHAIRTERVAQWLDRWDQLHVLQS
jgi:hypothetical protein